MSLVSREITILNRESFLSVAIALCAVFPLPVNADTPTLLVSPSIQAKRDKIRSEILSEEAEKEKVALTAAQNSLDQAKPTDIASLKNQILLHQNNLDEINKELSSGKVSTAKRIPSRNITTSKGYTWWDVYNRPSSTSSSFSGDDKK